MVFVRMQWELEPHIADRYPPNPCHSHPGPTVVWHFTGSLALRGGYGTDQVQANGHEWTWRQYPIIGEVLAHRASCPRLLWLTADQHVTAGSWVVPSWEERVSLNHCMGKGCPPTRKLFWVYTRESEISVYTLEQDTHNTVFTAVPGLLTGCTTMCAWRCPTTSLSKSNCHQRNSKDSHRSPQNGINELLQKHVKRALAVGVNHSLMTMPPELGCAFTFV